MQKVIRRTALARNQAQRKSIRAAKQAQREELKDSLRQRFAYNRIELDNVRAERLRRREDWMRGPLAPQRDAGLAGQSFGALNPYAMRPPAIPKHLRRKFINLAAGDRVCIMKGRDKGQINEVVRVDPENETVTVKDLNMADVHFPEWLSEQYGNKTPFQSIPIPIPIDDVRLIVALDDPVTGQTRDVLVEHIRAGGPFLEREHGVDIPKHTRYIAGENIEIPWPRPDPANLKDEVWDTLRMEVETPTWVPSLTDAPFPSSVLDELRNKYSKYRTRHDPEYVAKKRLEDLKKDYIRESYMTPREKLEADRLEREKLIHAKRYPENGSKKKFRATSPFIEEYMRKHTPEHILKKLAAGPSP
ncbi:hypothetical protein BJY01DRAFT_114369 [Aspergillus pseudoustus]|uniref:KOW domain-containing protein n=1 Tax=Aspergillus pseudoustus TaxID=1810923 RepID=A0ABR4KZQ0_9EURO